MSHIEQKVYSNQGNPALLNMVPAGRARALDLGCGAGDNARQLVERGFSVDGVTISQREAEIARRYCRYVYVYDLEHGLPGLDYRYDVIVCSHVLEHLCTPAQLFADVRAALKPDGCLLVAVPNMLFYKNRWKLLIGQINYTETGLMDETHYRWYTYQSVQNDLKGAGFNIEFIAGEGSIPIPARKAVPITIAKWGDALGAKMFPGLFSYQFVIRASIRGEA